MNVRHFASAARSRARSARASATAQRPLTSLVGGSRSAPWSANGNLVQVPERVVGIERAEPAVAALHAGDPVHGAGERLGAALGAGCAGERPHDGGRVIQVRIVCIGELERPPTARTSGRAARQSPGARSGNCREMSHSSARSAGSEGAPSAASCIASTASTVSQTGETQGWHQAASGSCTTSRRSAVRVCWRYGWSRSYPSAASAS